MLAVPADQATVSADYVHLFMLRHFAILVEASEGFFFKRTKVFEKEGGRTSLDLEYE